MKGGPLGLLLATGCLDVDGVDLVVDLPQGVATLTWQNFRGPADEVGSLDAMLEQGELTAAFPRATPLGQSFVADGETLDAVVTLRFSAAEELGFGEWDSRHPYRFCPLPLMVITHTNADYRDPQGCAVWASGAQVLRVNLRGTAQSTQPHLLEPWREAHALGAPAEGTPAEGAPAEGAPAEGAPAEGTQPAPGG